MNQRPGTLALRPFHRILRREPLGKAVNGDATGRRVRILTVGGRLVHGEALDLQCLFDLARGDGVR